MPGRPETDDQKKWDKDFSADYNVDGSVKKGSELYQKTQESVKLQQEQFVEDFTTRAVQGKPVAPPRPENEVNGGDWDAKYSKGFNTDGTIKQGTELYKLSDQSVRSRNTETLKNLDSKMSGIQSVSQIASDVSNVPNTSTSLNQVDNIQGSGIISAFSNLKNQMNDVNSVEETTLSKAPLKTNSIGSSPSSSMADVHNLDILRYFNMEVK
jgi:hypothetical protein